ncbi:hypothetical protein NPIL_45661 [Nephila pilipes]|uniref:Uncharacterized protein n=1 Tax=Nephila pilipes TaxID=299642 RepID=A0A8X6QWI2_NEPPI|nr:hypothetical protein NPIL_45661 [Nephila pilipes]
MLLSILYSFFILDENVSCCFEKNIIVSETDDKSYDPSKENYFSVEHLSIKKNNEAVALSLCNVFSDKLKFTKKTKLDTISSYINPFLRSCDLKSVNKIWNTNTSLDAGKQMTFYMSPSLHKFYENTSICSIADNHMNDTSASVFGKKGSPKNFILKKLNVLTDNCNVVFETPKSFKNCEPMHLENTTYNCTIKNSVNVGTIVDNCESLGEKNLSKKLSNLTKNCTSKTETRRFNKNYNLRSLKYPFQQCATSAADDSQDSDSKNGSDFEISKQFRKVKSRSRIQLRKHAFSAINHTKNKIAGQNSGKRGIPKELNAVFDDYKSKGLQKFKPECPKIQLSECSVVLKNDMFFESRNNNELKVCPRTDGTIVDNSESLREKNLSKKLSYLNEDCTSKTETHRFNKNYNFRSLKYPFQQCATSATDDSQDSDSKNVSDFEISKQFRKVKSRSRIQLRKHAFSTINHTKNKIAGQNSGKRGIPKELNAVFDDYESKGLQKFKPECPKTQLSECSVVLKNDIFFESRNNNEPKVCSHNDGTIVDNCESLGEKNISKKLSNLIENCTSKSETRQFNKNHDFGFSKYPFQHFATSTTDDSQDRVSKNCSDFETSKQFKKVKSRSHLQLHKDAFSTINHTENKNDTFTENRGQILGKCGIPKELSPVFDYYNSDIDTSKGLKKFKSECPKMQLTEYSVLKNMVFKKSRNCNESKVCPLTVPSSFSPGIASGLNHMPDYRTVSQKYFNHESPLKSKIALSDISCDENHKFSFDFTPKRNASLLIKKRFSTSFDARSVDGKHKTVHMLNEPFKKFSSSAQSSGVIEDKSNIQRKSRCCTLSTPQLIPVSKSKVSRLNIPQDFILAL